MCNVLLFESPEDFELLPIDSHKNFFDYIGVTGCEHIQERPIIVAVCSTEVDPIIFKDHLCEIDQRIIVVEPPFEASKHDNKELLSQRLAEFINTQNLPEPEVFVPEFDDRRFDSVNEFVLRMSEFIAAQSPVSAEPEVKEFVLMKEKIGAIFNPAAFVNVAKKPQYFITRNQRLPFNGNFSSKRLFSRKILRR